MSIMRITHLKGGDPAEMAAIFKDARKLWEDMGAERFSYVRYDTGPRMGESLVIQYFSDWASLGRAMDQRSTNKDYALTISRAQKIAEIVSVDILTDVDL